jgi:membrane protein implicated in regulation of membrane protease activity
MDKAKRSALLWLLAGVAFLVAGLLMPRRQMSFFAVAVLDFAVCIITLRRAPKPRNPTE